MEYQEFLKKKEVKVVDSGMNVADKDINKHLFDYQHDIVKWALKKGKSAVFAGTGLGKTSHRILVEGRLQIRNFDAKDGTKHWVTEVIASNVEFIEKKSETKPTSMAQMGQDVTSPADFENVPF